MLPSKTTLKRNFEAQGIVPSVAHDGVKVPPRVEAFFLDVLAARRKGG